MSWSGSPGTGASSIASYEIFLSVDGGPFTPIVNNTTSTSTTFTGQAGNTYGFYSIATNNLGPGSAHAGHRPGHDRRVELNHAATAASTAATTTASSSASARDHRREVCVHAQVEQEGQAGR